MAPKSRAASHAGSWYTSDGEELDGSLTQWLGAVSSSAIPAPLSVCDDSNSSSVSTSSASAGGSVPIPVPGCRAIIAPHAGYSYSGPAAAWAYSLIDVSSIQNVFILGPSHHVYLDGCAVTACQEYSTPLGSLPINTQLTQELKDTGEFSTMSKDTDEDEHSIEMHLPYIYKTFNSKGHNVQLVPILVGAINTTKEQKYGKLLAKYLRDPKNFFVVSSDFCHWGSRFSYTFYRSSPTDPPTSLSSRSPSSVYEKTPIHKSIRELDQEGIFAITHPHDADDGKESKTATKARDEFSRYLKETKNTVCGRHPISVLLSALSELEQSAENPIRSECRFTRYEQSSACLHPRDSSVSYASAFVRLLD